MSRILLNHLNYLYGRSTAREFHPHILELIARHPVLDTARERTGLPLSERDVLLITYGDQVREPQQPPLKTLGDFLEDHVAGVVNGVHLLPFFPYSSDDGFSVMDYYAVDPALGGWDDVKRIGGKFSLMFDAVFNHMSVQSEWFRRFLRDDPFYCDFFFCVDGEPDLSGVVRPRALPLLTRFNTPSGTRKVWTTFSADQVDLNARNPEVLVTLLDVLLTYVAHGARFIRLDAIAYLWKELGTPCIHLRQTHRIIQLMRAVLDEVAPEVMLVTETNVPHKDNVSYFGNGLNEAQLVYNFALPPLVLHAVASADASRLSGWVRKLKIPSRQVAFFNFLASHDGIGLNAARGILREEDIALLVKRAQKHNGFVGYKHNSDGSKSPYELNVNYFDALSDPNDTAEPVTTKVRRFLAAHAVMLSLAGMPGIYFHSLFGSRNDRGGAEESGIPRRINRQKLTRAELEHDLGDPHSMRSEVFSGLKKLLQVRCVHPAFHPAGPQKVLTADRRVFTVLRTSPDGAERVLCMHNLSGEQVRASLKSTEFAAGEQWVNLLTNRTDTVSPGRRITNVLEPYEVVWALI